MSIEERIFRLLVLIPSGKYAIEGRIVSIAFARLPGGYIFTITVYSPVVVSLVTFRVVECDKEPETLIFSNPISEFDQLRPLYVLRILADIYVNSILPDKL